LLPETAVHAAPWDAADIVARAAATSDSAHTETPSMSPQQHLWGPVVAGPLSPAPPIAPVPTQLPTIQPGPAAPAAMTSPYDAARFLTAARAKSDSIQWAVLGGTAAFLGVIWVTIWLVTGK